MLRTALVLATLAATARPQAASSAGRDLAARLPATTVAAVDIDDGGALVDAALRVVAALPELPARARLGLGLVDVAVRTAAGGLAPAELGAAVAPAGACVGVVVDAAGVAVVALVERPGPELEQLVARAGGWVRLARVGEVAVLAADDARLELLRRTLDGAAPQLGERDGFAGGRPACAPGRAVRLFADLARIRTLRPDAGPLWDRVPPDARLFAGPWAAALDRASRLDGTLELDGDALRLRLAIDGAARADHRARVLMAGADHGAPRSAATLLTVRLDRSVAGLLAHADAVLGEAGAARILAGLSTLDTLVGGSFVDDLLPALGAPWSLVVEQVDPADAPGLALPAFALCAPVVDRQAAAGRLDRLAGTFALAANAERRRQGRPAFQLRRADVGGVDVLFAEPELWRGPAPPPVEQGWTPTLALADRRLVLATHREVAERLIAAEAPAGRGDVLQADPARLAAWVDANRARMALGQVLDEGKTLIQAREDTSDLAKVLRCFAALTLSVVPDGDRTVLELALRRAGR